MLADAVIVGAGPAGLAAAQRFQQRGLKPVIFEKAERVGEAWRRHYDRLHLHTPRAHSSLPGFKLPRAFGRYPSRAQFVEYLEQYAERFALRPQFSTPVSAVRRDGKVWAVETQGDTVRAPIVVMATGWADFPNVPQFPGIDLYKGALMHSSAYRNGKAYSGARALVVGFGNSGAEIALDLVENGADVTLSQRSPVRVLPRDLFGVPILEFALLQRFLPARVADAINAPILNFAVGSLEKFGLKTARKGAMQMIEEDSRIPVLDVGALDHIRSGAIKVRGAVQAFTREGVAFTEGEEPFDLVVLATGYKPDLRGLLPDARNVLDDQGRPLVSDRPTAEPGLYFVGALTAATGQLREIRIGAARVGDLARRFLDDERGFAAGTRATASA